MLEDILTRTTEMLSGFVPSLLGAIGILVVGWIVAVTVRSVIRGTLKRTRFDERVAEWTTGKPVSVAHTAGTLVYWIIMLFVAMAVFQALDLPLVAEPLNALALEAVTAPASEMLASILNVVPVLFGAAVLLAIAYFIGRVVADLVTNVLVGAGFDSILMKLGLARDPSEGRRPSDVAGLLILVALMLFASIEAAGMLGFESLSDLISRFLVLGGQVVLGLVIFGIGLFLANVAESAVRTSSTPQAGLLAMATRVAIIVLAGAMGLRQMGLANEIITLAFGLLLGAIGVASALAFGLGARDVAGRSVENWVNSIKGS